MQPYSVKTEILVLSERVIGKKITELPVLPSSNKNCLGPELTKG
jgi:hypothetical protein